MFHIDHWYNQTATFECNLPNVAATLDAHWPLILLVLNTFMCTGSHSRRHRPSSSSPRRPTPRCSGVAPGTHSPRSAPYILHTGDPATGLLAGPDQRIFDDKQRVTSPLHLGEDSETSSVEDVRLEQPPAENLLRATLASVVTRTLQLLTE
ncbi:hypothetical protein DPMN_176352 [Dreissena polymorpha]|uniref:Uncharacterized protein n=1 Tax=Dreissena polymorpha TaxID=45954 RepID=A0A9D4E6R7_DREPO|nr:hypothetical protein DPMN_176352 [Dreissena polymorpha]